MKMGLLGKGDYGNSVVADSFEPSDQPAEPPVVMIDGYEPVLVRIHLDRDRITDRDKPALVALFTPVPEQPAEQYRRRTHTHMEHSATHEFRHDADSPLVDIRDDLSQPLERAIGESFRMFSEPFQDRDLSLRMDVANSSSAASTSKCGRPRLPLQTEFELHRNHAAKGWRQFFHRTFGFPLPLPLPSHSPTAEL